MEKCKCIAAGFCEFFRQEMTYSPPNWQWCQNATPEEREKFKISCDKKHKRATYLGCEGKYITASRLITTCREKVIPYLYSLNISGIVGIPRSGNLISAICATAMNIPLYNISNGKISICSGISDFGGYRMKDHIPSAGKIAVIDDTVFSGSSIDKTRNLLGLDFLYGCVYIKPESVDKVDFFGEELENPHILDWHFFNSPFTKMTLFDFDGIFSPDVPIEELYPEERYVDYITNVAPTVHRLPRSYKCKGIVTGRLDKYRAVTEGWLAKHNIEYESLIMFPETRARERDNNHIKVVADFKSKFFKESDAIFFMESCPYESQAIRNNTGKMVICPKQERFG